MKSLADCKDKIHSCSKCGLCQSVCPVYKITGNDCTVSRGHFIMLRGLIDGNLKMSKTINKYLDLCLKCGACSKFCPSGIDVVDIVALAKAEYFKTHFKEKFISFIQKYFIFGFGVKVLSLFRKKYDSKSFEKKILLFRGCGSYSKTSVTKLLNLCNIEVITPNFDCCGIPFFARGDMENFKKYMDSFFSKIDEYGINEIVTTCASCEKTLNSYKKWQNRNDYTVKNVFEYLNEQNINLKLKTPQKVTFHKPCNITNTDTIIKILNNTENLEYIQMKDYDKCCGLNGISKFNEYGILYKLFSEKRKNIMNTGAKTVLTSCLGCEIALKLFSFGKYKIKDMTEFLAEFL